MKIGAALLGRFDCKLSSQLFGTLLDRGQQAKIVECRRTQIVDQTADLPHCLPNGDLEPECQRRSMLWISMHQRSDSAGRERETGQPGCQVIMQIIPQA